MNREGADACNAVLTPSLEAALPTVFIGRESGFALFDVQNTFNLAQCLDATPTRMTVPVGTVGDVVSSVSAAFDGWGYVHLFNATTMAGLDQYAIDESRDEDFATGFGDLSVHEVAVDPLNANLAYLSYYAGGLRAIEISESASRCTAEDDDATRTAPCLIEVGGYLDDEGNNFWGVETIVRNGVVYILASDRDSGLWIFRRTP